MDGRVVAADDSAGNGFAELWSTTTVADGSHTLVARAHTAAGGTSQSPTVGFTVRNVG